MNTKNSRMKILCKIMLIVGILLLVLTIPICLYINSLGKEAISIVDNDINLYKGIAVGTQLEIKLKKELIKMSTIMYKNFKFTRVIGILFVGLIFASCGTLLILISHFKRKKLR